MPPIREVTTCDRCREFKQRCDRARPVCSRCLKAGVVCSFESSSKTSSSTFKRPSTFALSTVSTIKGLDQTQVSLASGHAQPNLAPSGAGKARAVRRRNRACLSCTRCHRHKVMCDKQLPCSRCKATGFADSCSYTHRAEGSVRTIYSTTRFVPATEDPQYVLTTWHSRHLGSSHWKTLLAWIGSLSRLDSLPFVLALQELGENNCDVDMILPGNFPFGSPGATQYETVASIIALIDRSKQTSHTYVENYMCLFEPLHPVLDTPKFAIEVQQFWINSSGADLSWLAQFLMVLGLGCYLSSGESEAVVEFYSAAEACLMKTPFMFRPSLSTLRALCLMVVAKQVTNATCWALDSCWSLVGLVFRLAVIMGLHQDPAPPKDNTSAFAEWESRRSLWTTILYLDIETAMITGMPSLLRQDEILCDGEKCLMQLSPRDLVGLQQSLLYNAFPIVLNVLARVNSSSDQMCYEEVLEYNSKVRRLMSDVAASTEGLRSITLDIFFRRALLVLHRQFAHHPDAPVLFPASYWSSLECSLALLVHHRELCEEHHTSQRLDLAAGLFMLDFFSAALTACIHLLGRDAPLSSAETPGCQIPPRNTILETLRSCNEIWSRVKDQSVCYRTGYRFLQGILDMIPESPGNSQHQESTTPNPC